MTYLDSLPSSIKVIRVVYRLKDPLTLGWLDKPAEEK